MEGTKTDLITKTEAAVLAGVSITAINDYIKAGRLTTYKNKLSRRVKLSRAEVEKLSKFEPAESKD